MILLFWAILCPFVAKFQTMLNRATTLYKKKFMLSPNPF
jgi:hypothetical protein